MSKLIPIDITGLSKTEEIMVPLKWLDYMAEIFWHSSSIEPKFKLDILPCNNDIASSFCGNNCVTRANPIILNGVEREKCIYHAVRVNWIKSVIEMYNSGDMRVKMGKNTL